MGNKKKMATAAVSLTLTEESSGKKYGSVNVKRMLKLDHLKSLSNVEACIPALRAFFGNLTAASAQQLCVPPYPSFFLAKVNFGTVITGPPSLVKRTHSTVKMENRKSIKPTSGEEEVKLMLKRKRMKLVDTEEEIEVGESVNLKKSKPEEEEAVAVDAKPLGERIRISGKGKWQRNHYYSFEYNGSRYELEDHVLIFPGEALQKPYVATIKDISQTRNGSLMVTGQWFYRPEDAEKKAGGNWESTDARELFYSFHRDQVPAESVMHKCVVHFIPLNKQIPFRKQHPGFIVQRVYDTDQQKLFKLTEKVYGHNRQEEIDFLVQKTMSRLEDLPDIEPNNAAADHEHQKLP